MNDTTKTIQETAMLFSLTIKQWSGKATDKAAGRELAASKGAISDSASVRKTLVFADMIDDAKKLGAEARQRFYALTLPWVDDGRRLGSAKAYQKIMQEMSAFQGKFTALAAKIETAYPTMIDEARAALGDLFNEADYPADVATKYGFEFRCEPIPSVDDIRVGLGEAERNKIKAQLKAQIEAAAVNAKRDIYDRAAVCVSRIADALPKFDPLKSGKERGTFRDSIISNVADLLDGLDGLNYDNDGEIVRLGEKLRALIAHTPEELREDKETRKAVAATAADILETMQGYCGVLSTPQGKEDAA